MRTESGLGVKACRWRPAWFYGVRIESQVTGREPPGCVGMKIESMKTERSGDRCKIVLTLLTGPETLKIYNLLRERFKDYSFSFSKDRITVKASFRIMEPWEDETVDELGESIRLELSDFIRGRVLDGF